MNRSDIVILAATLLFAVCVTIVGCDEKSASTTATTTDAKSVKESSNVALQANGPTLRVVEFENGTPVPKKGTLYIPTFVLRSSETSGGVMFAAQTQSSSRACLLSAMHLLGPATGMEKQLTVAEIAEQWSGVVATELIMRKEERFSGVGLGLPGASAEFEASQSGDVVVFIPQESKELNPISISDTDPEKGDVVWLLSPNLANDSLVHRAISVSVIHDGFLVYEFDEPIVIAGTSGAPIVNEEGLIVAVHRGGGTNDGKTIGVGTLANRFLPSLNGEIKKNSP